MSRATIFCTLCRETMFAPSMVLFEIDAPRLTVFEFERDTPGSIDVDRIAFRIVSLRAEEMKRPVSTFTPCRDQSETLFGPRQWTLVYHVRNSKTVRRGASISNNYH